MVFIRVKIKSNHEKNPVYFKTTKFNKQKVNSLPSDQKSIVSPFIMKNLCTVDGFIFVGTNFRGLNKNDTFVGFRIRGHSIFSHNSYRKLPFRGYFNSWIGVT